MSLVSLAELRRQLFPELYGSSSASNQPYGYLTHISSSSSGKPIYKGTLGGHAPKPKAPKAPSSGAGGFLGGLGSVVGNTLSDAKSMALGAVPGLIHLAEHPIASGEAIAHQYAHNYSPLIHGDFGTFFHQVEAHPLSYGLDAVTLAATIGSLGALSPEAVAARTVLERGAVASGTAKAVAANAEAGNAAGVVARALHAAGIPKRLARSGAERAVKHTPGLGWFANRMHGTEAARLRQLIHPTTEERVTHYKLKNGEERAIPEFSKNAAIRARQKTVARALALIPHGRVLSDSWRYSRLIRRAERRGNLGLKLSHIAFTVAHRKLSSAEAIALKARSAHLTPEQWAQEIELAKVAGHHVNDRLITKLRSPGVQQAYKHPSEKMMAAEKAARELGHLHAEVLVNYAGLSRKAIEERPYLHARLRSGAHFLTKSEAELQDTHNLLQARQAEGDAKIGAQAAERAKRLEEIVHREAILNHLEALDRGTSVADRERMLAHFAQERGVPLDTLKRSLAAHKGDRQYHQARITRLQEELHELPHIQEDFHHNLADQWDRVREGDLVGGKSIEELRKEGAAEGKPEPFYMPDQALTAEKLPSHALGRGGGGSAQRWTIHQARGYLFQTGKLAADANTLSPTFLATAKKALYGDVHKAILANAVLVDKHERLQPGWVYVRHIVGQKLHPIVKANEEREGVLTFHQAADMAHGGEIAPKDWVAEHADMAEQDASGKLYAVRESFLKHVTGEFKTGSIGIDSILRKPTMWWRSLLLGYRPAFLVNNFVGNSLMYAMRHGGMDGISAYARVIHDTYGPQKLLSLIHMKGTPKEVQAVLMHEFFPDQVEAGTAHLATNDITSKLGRGLFIKPTQHLAERDLRTAAAIAIVKKQPEYRAAEAALRKSNVQVQHWSEIATPMLRENPDLADKIAREIDDTLGNYVDLTPMERNVVKTYFPFWAWYKAIARTTAKLPETAPLKTAIVTKMAMIEQQDMAKHHPELPGFLQGALPLDISKTLGLGTHPNREKMLTMTGLNPWSTIGEEVDMLKGAGASNPGGSNFLSAANPFIQAAFQAQSGRSLLTGQPVKGGLAQQAVDVFGNLPQAQLLQELAGHGSKGTPNSLYAKGTNATLLGLLGLPIKQVNPSTAQYLKDQEAGKYKQTSEPVDRKHPPKSYVAYQKRRHHHRASGGSNTYQGII